MRNSILGCCGWEQKSCWAGAMSLAGGEIPCPSLTSLWHWRRGHPSKRWARRFLPVGASQPGYCSEQLGLCQPSGLREARRSIGVLSVVSCLTGWEEKGHKADTREEGKLEKYRQPAPLDLGLLLEVNLRKALCLCVCCTPTPKQSVVSAPPSHVGPEPGWAQTLSCLPGLQWSLDKSQTNASSPHHVSVSV